MSSKSPEEDRTLAWLIVAAAGVRATFGIVMAIDAYLKWQPAFAAHYVGYLQNAMKAQPLWLSPWFNFWLRLVSQQTSFFVWVTRLIETAIAVGLLLGFARRITYIVGALFTLLIWSTAEGFGGPYTSGATNLGPALVYALIFIAAALFERALGSTPYSLDYYIARRFPWWGSFAELAPREIWQHPPPILAQPLTPADVSYVLVQSEWYTQQVSGTQMAGDYDKMMNVTPDEVVFNGIAFQYTGHPLLAKVGQRVRFYVIDAGPNLSSAFHIIGGMFAAVYPDGDSSHALAGASTYPIAPGQGVVLDTIMQQPGKCPIVDHSMRNMMIGAVGQLNVTQ